MPLRVLSRLLCYCSCLLLLSCGGNGEWRDEGIDPGIRAEIARMNQQVLDAIKKNDSGPIRKIGSDNIKYAHKDSLNAFIAAIHNLNLDSISVRKQFYIRDRKGRRQTISTGQGEHDFFFRLQQVERDMFISIIDIHDSLSTCSLGLLYVRAGHKDWVLFKLSSGDYKFLGNDAVSWYRKAEEKYVKGADIDAYLCLSIALDLLNPGGNYIQYQQERNILDLKTDLSARIEREYQFPVEAAYATGTPQLFNISHRLYEGNLYPVIFLKTKLPLSDTGAISKQCDEVHAGLDVLFKKLNRNEHLLYEVYDEHTDTDEPGGGIVFVKHALKKYWQYRD